MGQGGGGSFDLYVCVFGVWGFGLFCSARMGIFFCTGIIRDNIVSPQS